MSHGCLPLFGGKKYGRLATRKEIGRNWRVREKERERGRGKDGRIAHD
jgi:hypothetical protein